MGYTSRNGQRVGEGLAYWFDRMNAAFHAAFGLWLIVTSGTRTRQEQRDIFFSRYVRAGDVRGRRVYDTRWFEGALWYRISSAGTVAQPGTSNHEEGGPNGARSIDIADSGGDPGVTRAGTTRDRWMVEHAHEFEFTNEGNNFGERWHKTLRAGVDPMNAPGQQAGGGGNAGGGGGQRPKPIDVFRSLNWRGIAAMLRATGRYRGNNTPGPVMFTAFQDFLNDAGYGQGLRLDGDPGDATARATQRWLKAKWQYAGSDDAWLGQGSIDAWNRAENANWNAFPGQQQWP